MDLSFAALGWLHRSAHAVGSGRFPEAVLRCRFYLEQAAAHAATPADFAVLRGLTASLEDLIEADADAQRLLEESVSGIIEACASDADRLLGTTEEAA